MGISSPCSSTGVYPRSVILDFYLIRPQLKSVLISFLTQNLRDTLKEIKSDIKVVIGLRESSPSWGAAKLVGFTEVSHILWSCGYSLAVMNSRLAAGRWISASSRESYQGERFGYAPDL